MKPLIASRKKLFHFIAAVFIAIFAGAVAADAATLIYRLEFRSIGEKVNDPRPRFGYLFVDSESGDVSTIIVLIDPVTRKAYHTTALITGRYFQVTPVLRRQSRMDVVNGGSGDGRSEFAALQMSGRDPKFSSVGSGRQVRLASFLSGYLLLSGADTLTEELPLTAEQISAQFGFVGYAKAEARFQRTATRNFGSRKLDKEQIIKFYTDELEAIGIEASGGPNPGPSPTPSPSATPVIEFDSE